MKKKTLKDMKKDPCWKGYHQYGTKEKGGKTVPNCVPVKESNNTPYVRPHIEKGSTEQSGWKASNKHGHVKYFGKEFKASALRHAGLTEDTLLERGADSKGYFRSTEAGAGLTAKGAAHFRRQNPGSHLSTAVTEKNPGGKRAARRRSFCARMSGMKGPMKDEKGRPTRKAMSLRRWRCH